MKFWHGYLTVCFLMLPATGIAGDCLPGTGSVIWSIDQVAALASEEFSCDALAQAIALAHAESGFRPFCVSSQGTPLLMNYSEDTGLWQMNDLRRNLEFEYGAGPPGQRNPQAHRCGLDPQCDLDYTHQLWVKDNGFNVRRWHAYGNEDYEQELAEARRFISEHPTYAHSCH